MAVYSSQFVLASLASGVTASFEVPAGYVAVIRSVTAGGQPGVSSEVIVQVDGVFVIALACVPVYPGGSAGTDWSGRIVLQSGQTLAITPDESAGVQASGYLLGAS